ncbi:Short-chain dehydrogenase/reductase SDR [Verrucomicrobia bacterium]|nr:Short-chain dehydrogenase/reductase SDR [Verrucomicrobiota bacterium]
MNTDLKGTVVLITGAAGGIGAAIARGFAAEGASLVLNYRRNRAGAAALQHELKGVESLAIRADLTSEREVERLFTRAVQRFGAVDTLVANAGAWESRDTPLHEMTLRQWRQTLDGVLTTTYLSLREFFRVVAKQKRGNAVLISSTAAIFGEAGHADYAAAKAAVAHGLTRSLKNELAHLAPHTRHYCGGRINCICPGWTVVPRTAAKLRHAASVRKVTATMALPQLARPEDIAHAAVFLASDALARHITGQTLVIAGGMEGRLLWQPNEVDPSLA